jgi:biopolymer transport protein ExbD
MKIAPPAEESRSELSVVPLVNVVFLLLVFFMLVGRLSSPEPLDIQPPRSVSGKDESGQAVKILLTRDGRVAVDRDIVPESALTEQVAKILAERPAASFQVKADGRTDAVWVIRIMERMRAAGVQRLTLLTERGAPG